MKLFFYYFFIIFITILASFSLLSLRFLFCDIPKAGWSALRNTQRKKRRANKTKKRELHELLDMNCWTQKLVKSGTIRLASDFTMCPTDMSDVHYIICILVPNHYHIIYLHYYIIYLHYYIITHYLNNWAVTSQK